MDSKKVILWPIIISIIGHVALISVSSLIDLRDSVRAAEIFTVSISEPSQKTEPPKQEPGKEEKKPDQAKGAKVIAGDGWREETVDLASQDVKYAAYLASFKKKIQPIWNYPAKAYERKEEGIVIVKISVDANGSLAQITLMSSSGSVNLDEGTLGVVKTAAPFAPLPQHYNLSRLHIVASFRYRVMD